jgi:hypothetical protein
MVMATILVVSDEGGRVTINQGKVEYGVYQTDAPVCMRVQHLDNSLLRTCRRETRWNLGYMVLREDGSGEGDRRTTGPGVGPPIDCGEKPSCLKR